MTTRAATWPSGTRVVWRDLTWGEYRDARSRLGPPAEIALHVYKLCVIHGPRPEEIPAGIMMWIYKDQLEKSPFSGAFQTIPLPLENARKKVGDSYLLCAQAFIASVFKIPFEVMDGWSAETLLVRLAQAEFVSGVPLNPVDPKTAKSAKGGNKRPKKPLTDAQQAVIERRNDPAFNRRPRQTGPGTRRAS